MSRPRFSVDLLYQSLFEYSRAGGSYQTLDEAKAKLATAKAGQKKYQARLYLSFSGSSLPSDELVLDAADRPDLSGHAALTRLAEIGRRYGVVVANHLPLTDDDLVRYLDQGGDTTGLLTAIRQTYLRRLIMMRQAALAAVLPPDLVRYVSRI